MAHEFLKELGNFATAVLASALALVTIVFVIGALRRFGWRGPIELVDFLGRLIPAGSRSAGPRLEPTVNVEYRDASGTPMDLGPYVKGGLRNGCGPSFELCEGSFVDCHPDRIKAGTFCCVSIQYGLVKETVRVQLDRQRQTLFIESQFTLSKMFERINGKS